MSDKELLTRLHNLKEKHTPKYRTVNMLPLTPTAIVIELCVSLAVGMGLGYALDKYLELIPLFTILFSILGAGGGIRNIYKEAYLKKNSLVKYQENSKDHKKSL